MVYCPQCGADNPNTARFCDQCGTELFPVTPDSSAAPPSSSAPSLAAPGGGAGVPATAGPTRCPQCGAAVIPGEAFCENCGAPLLSAATSSSHGGAASAPGVSAPPASSVPPQQNYPPPQPVGAPSPPPDIPPPPPSNVSPPPPPLPDAPAVGPTIVTPTPAPPTQPRTTLAPGHILCKESGVTLPLPESPLAVVGRADPVSNFYPDIDLSPYGALQGGVGRRHMQLKIEDNGVVAEDLDSTNGTALNGNKLVPRTPYPVRDGDELRLGTMVLQIQL